MSDFSKVCQVVYLEHADRAEPLTKQERHRMVTEQLAATHPRYAFCRISVDLTIADVKMLVEAEDVTGAAAVLVRTKKAIEDLIDEEWARVDRAMKGEL